jgi:hypothetical protein
MPVARRMRGEKGQIKNKNQIILSNNPMLPK